MAEDKKTRISLYLLKEGVDVEDAVKTKNKIRKLEKLEGGELYYRKTPANTPSWVDSFFDNEIAKLTLKTQSVSAVYVKTIEINGVSRKFLLPFGYGYTMINTIYCVDDFGLKLVLNTVQRETIKKISKKTLTSDPKNTVEQFSNPGDISYFGIDVEQDLLEAVTGKTKGEYRELLGDGYVTGKTGFSISKEINIHNLANFLKSCFELYNKNYYKKDFEFIDNIKLIKNPNKFDEQVMSHINNKTSDRNLKLWMAIPEIVEWENLSGFSFTNDTENPANDISYDDFQEEVIAKKKKEVDLKYMKTKRVTAYTRDKNQEYKSWSLYECLCGEISYSNDKNEKKKAVLSNGKWYEIEQNFSDKVENSYNRIIKRSEGQGMKLNSAKSDEKEDEYNKRMAEENAGFILMDRKLITHGGTYSRVEFCDLYDSEERTLYHIKKYYGSSALSHLFAQGRVSGQLFTKEPDFVKKVNKKEESLQLEKEPNARDYKIIYGIISDKEEEELYLPFFSKVNFRNEEKLLRDYNFEKVYLVKIQED